MEHLDLELEKQMTAIDVVVGTEGMITEPSNLILLNLKSGHESIFKSLQELVGYETVDKIDKELIAAFVKFKGKSESIRPEVLLHKEITVPTGMLNTYNSLIDMLTGMRVDAVKVYNAILEYDATVSKSITNKEYRDAFLRTDGTHLELVTSIKRMDRLKHEELNGEETSMLVMDAFTSLGSIPDLVTTITENKLPLDYDILTDITDNITSKTDMLQEAITDNAGSVEYLKSLSNITNVTANAVSMLTGIVYSIEITKKALTKALTEMAV